MSRFKTLVENILSEALPREYDYWRTTNPNDEKDEAYENWLNNQEYVTKYAAYVRTSDKFGKEYVCGERLSDTDIEWKEINELDINNPDFICLWNTPEEAQKAAQEYTKTHPEISPKVEKVYAKEQDGFFYDNLEDVYTYDEFLMDQSY